MNYADIILLNGKIITVDSSFSIYDGVAISGDKIMAVGSNSDMRELSGPGTKIIDLKGKCVIPGLIDAHLHPEPASVSELEEIIPDVQTIEQLLSWIKQQAETKKEGQWIIHPKFFPTRLKEMRQPTLAELDNAAPHNPVFLNGSFGGMINSEAMRLSGISDTSAHPGILKNNLTGKPNGFIRASAFPILRIPEKKPLSLQEMETALASMLRKYNQYGFTSLVSGAGDFESMKLYRAMADSNMLTARIYQNILIKIVRPVIKDSVRKQLMSFPLITGDGDKWVRTGPVKIMLDGGILTGTAFMKEPWSTRTMEIYGIDEPEYRGIVNYNSEELEAIISAANDLNFSFTVHATGEASVEMLLDVFVKVNKSKPVRERRFSIIHGNFFSEKSIERMAALGINANMQAAWFFKDAEAMENILGSEKMKLFHPYRHLADAGVIINGGSDHMVKLDADSSVNPYNPFTAMWSMVTRRTSKGNVINPSEALTREEALKTYTINNAFSTFEENIKGSIEPDKLADLAVLSDDILTCPEDKIREIRSLMTILGGKIIYVSSTGN